MATVTGHVYLYDGSVFRWSMIELRDANGNPLGQQQLDENGAFQFALEIGKHYQIVGVQPEYGYAPQALQVDVSGDISGLVIYGGPDSWFPAPCVLSPSGGPPLADNNGIACYVDIEATATDSNGNSGTSAKRRIYFGAFPTPSPTITPTPTPTATQTSTPTPTPTPSPSPSPTATPTPSPTATPTPKPSPTPVCVKRNPNGKCLKWN